MSFKPDALNATLTLVNVANEVLGYQIISKDPQGATRLEGLPSENCKGLSTERHTAGMCTVWTRVKSIAMASAAKQSLWGVRVQTHSGLLLDLKTNGVLQSTFQIDFNPETDLLDHYRLDIMDSPWRVVSNHPSLEINTLFVSEEAQPSFTRAMAEISQTPITALRYGFEHLTGIGVARVVPESHLQPYLETPYPIHAVLADYADLGLVEALLERVPNAVNQAGTLVFGEGDEEVGLYPLHLASCFLTTNEERNLTIIQHLIKMSPKTASQAATSRRLLPLHLAVIAGASSKIVEALWNAFPRAEEVPDRDGKLPRDYLLNGISLPRLVERMQRGTHIMSNPDLPSHCRVFVPVCTDPPSESGSESTPRPPPE